MEKDTRNDMEAGMIEGLHASGLGRYVAMVETIRGYEL